MKKLLVLIILCLTVVFILYTGNDTVVKEAKAVIRTPAPDHYYMEHETVKDFAEWIKGPTAKTDNQGVFSYVVDRYKNYGYIICPYGETDADIKVNMGVGDDDKWGHNITFNVKNPAYRINIEPLIKEEDRKYAILGIDRYVKEKTGMKDYVTEYKPHEYDIRYYRPGEKKHGYIFRPAIYKINNFAKEVLAYADIHYSPYIKDQVYVVTYGFAFIENGMLVNVDYEKHENTSAVVESIGKIKFVEEILDDNAYQLTKTSFENAKKELQNEKLTNNNQFDNTAPDATAKKQKGETKPKKKALKIIGKKKIKCNKTRKYKVKKTGIKGKVKWSVDKKSIAKVSKNGKLKALNKGIVKLTAKIKNVKTTISIKIVK